VAQRFSAAENPNLPHQRKGTVSAVPPEGLGSLLLPVYFEMAFNMDSDFFREKREAQERQTPLQRLSFAVKSTQYLNWRIR
jgi:hypothetical protein